MQIYFTTETDPKIVSLFNDISPNPEWYVFHVPHMYASIHRINEGVPVIREYTPKDLLVAELEDDLLNYVPRLKTLKRAFAVVGLPANAAEGFLRLHPDAMHVDTRTLIDKLNNGKPSTIDQTVTESRSASSPSRAARL